MRIIALSTAIVLTFGVTAPAGDLAPDSDGSGSSDRRVALELRVPTSGFMVGERVAFDVVFGNVSGDSLRLFHPSGPPYSGWYEWTLGVRVEDPAGAEWEFVPSWKYSLIRVPRTDQFRWLAPGGTIEMPFEIKPISEAGQFAETTVTGGGEAWYVSIPLTFDRWTVDRDSLEEATGITRFDTYSVSRGKDSEAEDCLQIISVLEAVFRKPGLYRIRVDYDNRVTGGFRVDETLAEERYFEVDGSWTGALSTTVDLVLRPGNVERGEE